jgi:hypothetical protein
MGLFSYIKIDEGHGKNGDNAGTLRWCIENMIV